MQHLNKFYILDQAELKTLDPFQEALNREQYAEVNFKSRLIFKHFYLTNINLSPKLLMKLVL